MKRHCIITLIFTIFSIGAFAQAISPKDSAELAKLQREVDPVLAKVQRQSDWLYSRLQMYWSTNATDVYIKGEQFDHPGGDRAPEPTVKFNGTRSHETSYDRPKLEDVIPYFDDANGSVSFVNRTTGVQEKTHPSKTGGNIAGMNQIILGLARKASRIYTLTGKEPYAAMAAGVFDVYIKGIYYRNVPTDLNHGHQQTLVGMTTFEVIHEDNINEAVQIYENLKPYLDSTNFDLYDAAFKKWAEVEIANGVPHNNWDLFQAEFIFKIAMILREDAAYDDHKGKEYYIDYILNKDSIRQWSMRRLADFAFDPYSFTWYESPGYSTTVLGDFSNFANTMDEKAGIDLFEQIPELPKAILTAPQYLFPNRMIAGFGDTHPGYLNDKAVKNLRKYAERHGNNGLMTQCDSLLAAINPDASNESIEAWVSPSFYAENVSWAVERSGMDPQHDLMASINGSLGNHQHANGISLELYGKGYVLAPDGGIGKYLYSGIDYSEYYSQFPAHNTVCVDGVSSYPVMMSQHAFKIQSRYPSSNKTKEFSKDTYISVEFTEPETDAQQQRTTAIVKTSETGGYYIDIFRSKRRDGRDKTHDYFYHNLGQMMSLTNTDGSQLELKPTDELAFAGGHLYAYSYIYNKYCTHTSDDIKAVFTTECTDGRKIEMNMWMQGAEDRKIVKALSPANLEYERIPNQPYDIENQPVLTLIVRQNGEAWSRPFVAVYEPTSSEEPSEIESVEFLKVKRDSVVRLKVHLKNGHTDIIKTYPNGKYKIRHK